MMDIGTVFIFVIVFLCSILILSRPRNLPPGPLTLPFVGSCFFLRDLGKKQFHLALLDASHLYGNIFSFRIGSQLFVALTGWDAIQQALVRQADVFSDRPNFLAVFNRVHPPASMGIVFRSYTRQLKTLRRFTLQTLKDFGVGKTTIEEKIATEISAARCAIEDAAEKPCEISPILQRVVGNVIYGIIFGKRIEFSDPEFDMIRRMSSTAVQGRGASNIVNFFPRWVSWIFMKQTQKEADLRRQNFLNIRKYINDQIKIHEDTYDEGIVRDFVDLYIRATHDAKEDEKVVVSKDTLFRVILELFLAGAETTYNTLDWAFLFMSEYPSVQEKCFKEIQETVADKYIEYSDRVKMKYVEATIMEVQRLANIAPTAVQHATLQNTTLLGYCIPKKTIIIPNLYSALMDANYWDEPSEFRPERFLGSDGNLRKIDTFVPFGTGPRTCLGEPLARMELFIVFSNLLQKFKFERENENFRHSMASKPNQITSSPVSYKMRITQR